MNVICNILSWCWNGCWCLAFYNTNWTAIIANWFLTAREFVGGNMCSVEWKSNVSVKIILSTTLLRPTWRPTQVRRLFCEFCVHNILSVIYDHKNIVWVSLVLHWLHIREQVTFTNCFVVYTALRRLGSSSLADMLASLLSVESKASLCGLQHVETLMFHEHACLLPCRSPSRSTMTPC